MSKKITWSLVEIDKSLIKPNPNNPKIQNEKGRRRLQKLTEKYGRIFDGIINKDYSLIDGHSRLEMEPTGIGKYFMPSRQLSKEDYQELNALFDLAQAGDIDQMIMEETFKDEFFEEWELDKPKEKAEIKEMDIQPYKKTHVLLSFPPEKMIEVQELLQKLKNLPFVEYEQSAN